MTAPPMGGQFGDLDQKAFAARLAQGDVVLVDLRTPAETALGTFPGALLVDYWTPAFDQFLRESDHSRVYLVYCAHGVRGRQALVRMRQAGFIEVHNLTDGYAGWKESP